MTRPAWVPDTTFYQIFPDRFRNGDPGLNPPDTQPWGSPPDRTHFQGGDLVGVTERLAYLEKLGIGGIYLNPIFTADTNHRYDTRNYLEVDPHLGDIGILRELVQEAHQRNIRIVLDGVFNHCGWGHPAFQDWSEHRNRSSYRDWFIGWDDQTTGALNYQTCGGADYLPKLNTDTRDVREHLIQTAMYWIEETGIDGWRLDVPWKIPIEFWEEFSDTVRTLAPDAYLVGEIWRDATPWLNVFDGVMNYQQRSTILDYAIYDHMDAEDFRIEITELLERHGNAAPWMLNLVGGHDTPRVRTLANGDLDRTLVAFAAMFTLPGAPMVYYGDEIGLEGNNDPGCRGAMPQDETDDNRLVRETVTRLIAIRNNPPALRSTAFDPIAERNGLLVYQRGSGDDIAIVIINPRTSQQNIEIPVTTGLWRNLVDDNLTHATGSTLRIKHVDSQSYSILVPEPS